MRLNTSSRPVRAALSIGTFVMTCAVVFGIMSLVLYGRVFIIPTPLLQGTTAGSVQATLMNVHETTSRSGPIMTGYVANTGHATIYGMNAMIEAFDQNGQIISVCHATPARLRPGESVRFDAPMTAPGMISARLVSLYYI